MKTIIKNGTLVTAEASFKADVLIEGETIQAVGESINLDDAEIIDASEKLVLPGGIDPHVHFELEMMGTVSSDDHYSGGKQLPLGALPRSLTLFLKAQEAWKKASKTTAKWQIPKPASITACT